MIPIQKPTLGRILQIDTWSQVPGLFLVLFWAFYLYDRFIAKNDLPSMLTWLLAFIVIALAVLVWRYASIQALFSYGLESKAIINSVNFYKDCGKIFFTYTFELRSLFFIAFLVIYLVLVAGSFQEDALSNLEISRIFRHLLTLFILAYFIFQPFLKGRQAAARLWADPLTRRPIHGRISSLGIQFDPSQEWMAWESFVKLYQATTMAILVTADWTFALLLRAFFKDETSWNQFNSLLASKVKPVIE